MYRRIFLDTNPIVYLLEKQLPFALKVHSFLMEGMRNGAEFYTSTITDTEFLAKPYRIGDYAAIDACWGFLARLNVLKCFVNEEIAVDARRNSPPLSPAAMRTVLFLSSASSSSTAR